MLRSKYMYDADRCPLAAFKTTLKGTVHQKMKIHGQFTHPQAIQDVNEFVCSSEKIWKNVASPMDPLRWMGAVRMRVLTADKNIPINHNMTPVYQLTSCEVKICMFVRNKPIIREFFISDESSIHNIAFSSEKLVLSESREKYAVI